MRDSCINSCCPQPEPNHAWGSEWLIYDMQCLGAPAGPGDPQGQISQSLVLEQSYTHTQCVCARCSGMGNTQAMRKHLQPVQTVHFFWGKDTILYCMYSMAMQHSGTNCINCTVSSQWNQQTNKCCCQKQRQPNHAWGSVWLFYDLQCISGRQQWGQCGVAVFYSWANHIHSVWVRCPGMVKIATQTKPKVQ